LTDAALTARATGSSIDIARTVRQDAAMIFFMVDDPSRIVLLITESVVNVLVAT
jgi:hypothetical protein